MKTHQGRINSRAMRRDAVRSDAVSLARFIATGVLVLILSAVVLQVFDHTAELADVISDRIGEAITPAE